MFCPYYPVQEVWEGLLSKVFDAWSLKMIQRNSGEGCIDENAPSAASHDSFQRVHIAYWSHWSQLTMSMADRKFNQMNKLIANILLLSCPCLACNLITWIRLEPNEICVEFWFVSHCTMHLPRMEGWINFCLGLPTLQNCTHLTFYKEEADAMYNISLCYNGC